MLGNALELFREGRVPGSGPALHDDHPTAGGKGEARVAGHLQAGVRSGEMAILQGQVWHQAGGGFPLLALVPLEALATLTHPWIQALAAVLAASLAAVSCVTPVPLKWSVLRSTVGNTTKMVQNRTLRVKALTKRKSSD